MQQPQFGVNCELSIVIMYQDNNIVDGPVFNSYQDHVMDDAVNIDKSDKRDVINNQIFNACPNNHVDDKIIVDVSQKCQEEAPCFNR